MTDICFTVCFDQAYIEPALLTALELLQQQAAPVYLIYLENTGDSPEVRQMLQAFASRHGREQLRSLAIQNTVFDKFEKYHFSNAILYKTLVPSVVQHDYVISIDAGYLLGSRFAEWMDEVKDCLEQHYPREFVLASFCGNSARDLPAPLHSQAHHARYPTGGVLLFSRAQYLQGNWYERIVAGYLQHKNDLLWAEQDLLCLLLEGAQLQDLPLAKSVLLEQLHPEGLLAGARSAACSQDFSLYKISGTLKPWKYWVLDPRKYFYLQRRQALAPLALENYPLIQELRHAVNHVPLQRNFLEVQERLGVSQLAAGGASG